MKWGRRGSDAGDVAVTWLDAAEANDRALQAAAVASIGAGAGADIRIVRACRSCGSSRHGKPEVAGSPGVQLHVSLSRAGGLAVIAVSDAGPVGVDVEHGSSNRREAGPDVETWVRKESVLKATGHGLMIDPDLIDVSAPGTEPGLLGWRSPEPLGATAWLFDLPCPPGFFATATVLAGQRPRLLSAQATPEA